MLRVIELDIEAELSGDTGVWEVAWVEYPAIEQELVYFGKQKFYVAPEDVAAKACRAIKENEERGNPASTQVGKVRGQQLCNRSEVSLETIKRMKSYLERAAEYYTGDYDDNGTIAYDLWGGKPALEWTNRVLESIKEQEMADDLQDACWEGYEARGLKELDGRMVPNCVKIEQSKEEFVYPEAGEEQNDFIGRCIPILMDEGKTQEQAIGACYGMWDSKKEFAVGDRVGFDWEVLKTSRGLRAFKNERLRGSTPVLFIQGLPTRDLIQFTNEYNIPVSAINMYSTWGEKARLIKVMGLDRHYDNDINVVNEIGNIATNFDYDTSALPPYESYPESGDTESMLTKPVLPPVLFSEDCGCNKKEEFDLVGFVDGMPVFSTPEEALTHADEVGCEGYHEHTDEDGNVVYMACDMHPEELDFSAVQDEESKEIINILKDLKQTDKINFEAVTSRLARGFTRAEVLAQKHKNKTTYYEYKRVLDGEPDREFCDSIEGRFFRIAQIYALQDYNKEFGHGKGGAPYSKWLYKGGPNCVHAWVEWSAQGSNFNEVGRVNGKPGTPPKEMPNQGYYSEKTKRASEVAYIISQQNMSNVIPLNDDLTPLGYIQGLPIYEDPLMASDASYLLGCGGITEEVMYEGTKRFQACSYKTQKAEVQEQLFKSVGDKRMIYTPLMIPNILIPRLDEVTGERYFVKFKPEVIEKIQQKFMIEQRLRETNYEHTDKKFSDAVLVESWIVGGDGLDKAYNLGFTKEQVPMGTWMGGYKILDTPEGNDIWDKYIKTGKVRGASVEGNFLLQFSRQNNDEYLLSKIINILKKTE